MHRSDNDLRRQSIGRDLLYRSLWLSWSGCPEAAEFRFEHRHLSISVLGRGTHVGLREDVVHFRKRDFRCGPYFGGCWEN